MMSPSFKTLLFNAFLAAQFTGLACVLSAELPFSLDSSSDWVEDFENPPVSHRSMPMWHINGEMTTQGINEQLTEVKRSGFGGMSVLPVSEHRPSSTPGTAPRYLSEDYFEYYGQILETTEKLGMKAIFYDDIDFPSGTAGGRMQAEFPGHVQYRLDKHGSEIEGPKEWEGNIPDGVYMGAVAMNLETMERRDISDARSGGEIHWQAPEGKWRVMVFTCQPASALVDYLNPEAVDKFFSLTYDQYYRRFSEHFGSTIIMSFYDDVGLRRAHRRIWTPIFNDAFEEKFGYSPVAYYPALWHDIGTDTEAARVALFGFRAEMLSEGYPRKVNEWSAERGMLATGHAMGQYKPQPTFLAGDAIKFYRHSSVPMIDSIHYYGHGRPGFKLTTSASTSFDRPLTAVEIYGNYRQFDATMMYRSGMELFARGANFFIPHGMWYDPEKVRIRPLISHFNPEIGPMLPAYNDWAARSSLLLRGGRHVADVGVLYPVASMWAYAHLDAVVDQRNVPGNRHPGDYVPEGTDLNELSDSLTGEIRRDFTFLHPEVLDERCVIRGDRVHLRNEVNFQDYQVIIIPAGRVIHLSNLEKIKAFYDAGGKVIATSLLPSKSAEIGHDAEVVSLVQAIFGLDPESPGVTAPFSKQTNAAGGAAYFVPSISGPGLASALQDAQPVADVAFSHPGEPVQPDAGMLSYIHKVKDGRHIYYFANSSDDSIEMDVELRGDLDLEVWDPADGSVRSVETRRIVRDEMPCTQVGLELDPVTALFLVEKQPH